MPDEFIMPVTKADAVEEMHLHALRQISDALAQTNRSLDLANQKQDSLATAVHELTITVARLEERDVRAELKAMGTRVDALERIKDRQDGAIGAGTFLAKYAPWLLTVAAAAMAGLGWKNGG